MCCVVFFFQAEDGIRDRLVTGVQTCALPISMGRLDGKVALISGGARGQGAAEANLFAREGAKVVFGDVLDDQGKQVEAEIHEVGGEALYIHLDVTREADWVSAVETTVSRYGKLDILVNNAGITIRKNVEDTTEEDRSEEHTSELQSQAYLVCRLLLEKKKHHHE